MTAAKHFLHMITICIVQFADIETDNGYWLLYIFSKNDAESLKDGCSYSCSLTLCSVTFYVCERWITSPERDKQNDPIIE